MFKLNQRVNHRAQAARSRRPIAGTIIEVTRNATTGRNSYLVKWDGGDGGYDYYPACELQRAN
jgi:hypothetical protein